MKLFEILFEGAEEYYQKKYRSSGGINKELSIEELNVLKSRGADLIGYDPFMWSEQAAKETAYPNDLGGFERARRISGYDIVISLKDKKIYTPKSGLPLHDPFIAMQLGMITRSFPEFMEYELSDGGLVSDLLSGKKEITGRFPRYKKGEDGLFDELKFEVFKDIKEISWYHATRESNLESIKRQGLIQSKAFKDLEQQRRGWTQFNFDLQNAIYLTHDIERARDIAKTLSDRYEESAVILKIDGKALVDDSKIVVDEDVLRDEYTGNVIPHEESIHVPEYIMSIIDKGIASIGYKGKINPEYLEVVETIEYRKREDENS